MKLDFFREALNSLVTNGKLTEDTAGTYLGCVKRILEQAGEDVSAGNIKSIIANNARTKAEMIKYVSAIRKYEEEVMKKDKSLLFGEPESELFLIFNNLSKKPNKKEFKHSSDTISRKINALRNQKLKYALRLQLKSGLRVKEIAGLKKEELLFGENNDLKVIVNMGKGRKSRVVDVMEDQYLSERLSDYVDKHNAEEPLFYSRNYIKKKAAEVDIKTHDLRRINAKERMNKALSEGKSRDEAKLIVKEQLGHEKIKTTDIYLGYRFKKK